METSIVRLELILRNENLEFKKFDIKKHPDQEYETVAMFKGYQQDIAGNKTSRRIYKREIDTVVEDYKDINLITLNDCTVAHLYCAKEKIKEGKLRLLKRIEEVLNEMNEEALRFIDAVPGYLIDIENERAR